MEPAIELKLGFDQLREKLRNHCLSDAGKVRVDGISFSSDFKHVQLLLLQNLEFKQIFDKAESFPYQYFYDPSDWVKIISLEGNYLEERDLLDLGNMLLTILECHQFFVKNKEVYPALFELAEDISIKPSHAQRIHSVIDENAIVKDSASPALATIRKRIREEQNKLRRVTEQVFKRAVAEQWVPEGSLPSIRDGRLAIPVSAEHKRKLRGFILDESATGQTVFIEPVEILESNNEIRELEYAEKREVIRILKEVTNSLRKELDVLVPAFDFLAQIDFVRAKAKLSREIEADFPILCDHPELVWYNAKHPLLYLSLKGRREVVPLTVALSTEDPMLLVSGPNAGGKSVCLKTIGLLQYMVQCGLLIPLSERSRVGVFDRIFLDIGDQQSIENDLSTYSSHLKNMNVFVREATDRSLVLMDELGSGTDPNFGGAIAQAVLHALLKKKVWGVATTHYYNLKLFAGQQPGIRNAAMRFDEENMVPRFMLDIGKPGSSFALEIAKKTGLPESSLEEAEELVGKDLAGFEKLIRTLEKEREDLHVRLEEMEKKEQRMKQSLARYESLSTELETKKKEIINKAKDEAANLLRQTNREIEKTIRHIRENKAEKKETTKVRNSLKHLANEVTRDKHQTSIDPVDIKPGDRVRIIGQESSGIVLQVQGKNAAVNFGELKSSVALSKLEKISGTQERQINKKLQSIGMNVLDKRISFSPSLDIRGKRVDEVLAILDPFLDTAILLGQSELKILHGKGEGVLRKVVREHLKKYKEVASVSDEHIDRGGDGITLVVLK